MTQEAIYEKFRAAAVKHEHLIEVAEGSGIWLCPQFPEISDNTNFLPIQGKSFLTRFNYCPFCGEHIDNNKEFPKEYKNYTVWYFGEIYSEDTIPGMWHSIEFNNYEDAMAEYRYLGSCEGAVTDVYIKDNEYDVIFQGGEWS